MGTFNPTTAPSQAIAFDQEYLMFNEGLIMSSGNPNDFCGQDSDQNTKNWYLGGDGDLTSVVQERYVFNFMSAISLGLFCLYKCIIFCCYM